MSEVQDSSSGVRQPIGITVADRGMIVVVCSDGAVFSAMSGLHLNWEAEAPIPGTQAASG